MDPQNGSINQHGITQGQGQQRYCPTPIMAPPPLSPAPPMQHQLIPQPSISPAPHAGYYSHHPAYPPPQSQQQPYYQNYAYQSHAQPPSQATHYSHQQHHQQWGGHHSYYQTQSVDQSTHPQQSPYQSEIYPPQPQSPYPPYVQHQQHQRMHHPALQSPPQQQPQHALMNLSRFVSQQSPSPSPVPMSHSPTTPVQMGSPHYHQQPNPGHMTPQPPPISYPQAHTPQGHMTLPPNGSLHSSFHVSPSGVPGPTHLQQQHLETQRSSIIPCTVTSNSAANSISNHPTLPISPAPVKVSLSDQVQNSSNETLNTNPNPNHALYSNGGGGGGRRSESTSPSSSVSSNRALLSPPPTPNPVAATSTSNNGSHMIPVRLQNMQSGARTKASMRKLMQEQQISTAGSVGSGAEDNPTSEPESSEKLPTPKRSPKKPKKGAIVDEESAVILNVVESSIDVLVEEGSTSPRRRGRKPGPKPKVSLKPVGLETPKIETPKITGRSRKKSMNPEISELGNLSPIRSSVTPTVKNASEIEEQVSEEHVSEESLQDKQQQKKPKTGRAKFARKKTSNRPLKKARVARNKKVKGGKVENEYEVETTAEPVVDLENEILETPTRPIRMRAAKEQTKKADEPNVATDRSRLATRAKRASVSYKEMSTSRSKSPKEINTPTSNKKSPNTVKNSPKSVVVAKTSPRLKVSLSPGRLRNLKDQSPLESRRESKASMEQEETIETPKRTSRKAKKKIPLEDSTVIEPDVKVSQSPKTTSKKSKREITPVRMSSPRLAKEKLVTPTVTTPVSLKLPEEEEVKLKGSNSRKAKSSSRRKLKTTVKATGSARKRKMVQPENQSVPDGITEPEASEPAKKKAKVGKKGRSRQGIGARKRKGRSHPKQFIQQEIVQITDQSINEMDISHENATTRSDDIVGISLDLQSDMESSYDKKHSLTSSSNANASETAVKKVPIGVPLVLESRRRSKSPRQNIDTVSTVPDIPLAMPNQTIANQIPIQQQHLSQVDGSSSVPLVLPAAPIDSAYLNIPTTSNLQLLSDSVNSIMSSRTIRPKKPRKPRVLKSKKSGSMASKKLKIEKITAVDKTKTKKELKQLEFRKRKARLELEVAQSLLDMKHSSKSPSPVKISEAILTPTTSSSGLNITASTPKKVGKTRKPVKSVKPRKHKSNLSTDHFNTRPSTPLFSQPLQPTLSPDIATPLPNKKSRKGTKRIKKVRPGDSQPLPAPTILAVPQINGNQGLNFSKNGSISFQNTPNKTGPVKVAKTVIPPGVEDVKNVPFSDIESTIAGVSSGLILPLENQLIPATTIGKSKPKRSKKQKVATKTLLVTSPIETQKPKPKRPRKMKAVLPNIDTSTTVEDSVKTSRIEESTAMDTSCAGPSSENLMAAPLTVNPVKKKRAYRRSPFKLTPKAPPVPTVFVKSPTVLTSNGPTPSTSSSSDKDKLRTGPTLKVIGGKTQFFRGGEKEEVDLEPPIPKRGQTQFDSDVAWLCCFCNLGPHAQKLGDLFGPYYSEQKAGSGKAKSTSKIETWMHQDCALWAGNVVLVGSKLHGLEETLGHSKKDLCTTCGNKGATIGCLKRGCKQAVHFPCAIRKSWKLDVENFHSFCPAHVT